MSLVFRKVKAGYSFANDKPKVNHLLFLDDMKLFGRSSVEIDKLVSTIYLVSTDMCMEFGITKCSVLVLKKGKVVDSDGVTVTQERVTLMSDNINIKRGIFQGDSFSPRLFLPHKTMLMSTGKKLVEVHIRRYFSR